MKKLALWTVAWSLLCCSCSWAGAQSAPDEPSTYRVEVRVVQVEAQVLNKKTRLFVPALKQEDFLVLEDDVPQTISSFSQDKLPLSIVILFDLTDSVRPVLKTLAEGALEALEHLKPEDEVTVMVYAAATQVLQEATTDRALAVAAIEKASRMKSDEAAFFNEGIFQAAAQLTRGKNPASRRVIIWLTDDVPNIPSQNIPPQERRSLRDAVPHTQQEAMKELLWSGTVVCSLLKGSELSEAGFAHLQSIPAERMLYPPGEVYKYASATGGQVIEYKKKELKDKLAALIDNLRLRYSLGYHPSAQKPKGKFCRIKVQLAPETGKQVGKVEVEARQGYYR